jgi:hypothetical protein
LLLVLPLLRILVPRRNDPSQGPALLVPSFPTLETLSTFNIQPFEHSILYSPVVHNLSFLKHVQSILPTLFNQLDATSHLTLRGVTDLPGGL